MSRETTQPSICLPDPSKAASEALLRGYSGYSDCGIRRERFIHPTWRLPDRRKTMQARLLSSSIACSTKNSKRVLLPLLDAPQNILDGGRDLFDVRIQTVEDAVRTQILSGDPWMSACAIAGGGRIAIAQCFSRYRSDSP